RSRRPPMCTLLHYTTLFRSLSVKLFSKLFYFTVFCILKSTICFFYSSFAVGVVHQVCIAKATVHQLAFNVHHPGAKGFAKISKRSEEHTSELQSRENIVCSL